MYIALSPAVSYEFNENFSLGANVRIMYSDSEIRTQVNNNLLGQRFEDGKVTVQSDGMGYGVSLGALYSFSPDTRIGVNWSFTVNVLDTGSAPIDTGPSVTKGRVVGEFKDHYTLMLGYTFNWR